MKIIVDRTADGEPVRIDCRACKSTIETETAEDFKVGEFGGVAYAGERGTKHYYLQCPACGADNKLESSVNGKIPYARRQELDREYRRRN